MKTSGSRRSWSASRRMARGCWMRVADISGGCKYERGCRNLRKQVPTNTGTLTVRIPLFVRLFKRSGSRRLFGNASIRKANASWGQDQPEPDVVVPVLGVVVVPIRHAAILRGIDPRAAAQHAVRPLCRGTGVKISCLFEMWQKVEGYQCVYPTRAPRRSLRS